MSQILVTGEAKIRDIQGPVVANSGVITALDGAASQYVRGDGTLADFPTSTGGGSSVSYYLNSSVSQGTIGGNAYRQLSKTPISGAGTDITASTNGYIANYITDANDPSLLEVPAGNFNCEFYFSVNSNNHNPYVYAELYKYNGTTFTLLGSNQAIPEYLSNGTTLSAYYFAIPVAVASLTITDRLAIRIYANVDTRTVTLHTENNHLCQVVTTFSKGLTSLNNLTRQVQFLGTGTSGTDFNISSSVATHTFNLPVASATNTGKLSSTDWSTFNNKLSTATAAATYVPYTGATTNVDLGGYSLSSRNLTANGNVGSSGSLHLKQNDTINVAGLNYGTIATNTLQQFVFYWENASFAKRFNLDFSALTALGTAKTFTLPDLSGTLALTSDLNSYVPYNGATTGLDLGIYSYNGNSVLINGNGTTQNGTLLFKQGGGLAFNSTGYSGIGILGTTSIHFNFNQSSGVYKQFNFNVLGLTNNTLRTLNIPDATGTIALTSDLSGYVPYTGATADVNLGIRGLLSTNTIQGAAIVAAATGATGGEIYLSQGSTFGTFNGYGAIGATSTGAFVFLSDVSSGTAVKDARLNFGSLTNNTTRTYTFPDATGTLALTSNLSDYLPLTGGTLTGGLSGTTATFSGLGTFYQLTMTGATAGRIFYAQTGGVVSQSGNLNWNETNGMLGVGTPNPSAVITAFSNNAATQFKAAGTAPAFTFSQSLTTSTYACVFGLATSANHFITGTAAGDMAIANQSATAGAIVFGTGTAEKMRMSPSGRLLVGTSVDSGALFQVAGAATFSSSVTATSSSFPIDIYGTTNNYGLRINNVQAATLFLYSSNANAANRNWGLFTNSNVYGDFDIRQSNAINGDLTNGANSTSRLYIKNDGNVGIGTSSPFAIADTNLTVNGTTSSAIQLGFNGTRYGQFYTDSGEIRLSAVANLPLTFYSNNTERMRITSGGDISFNGGSGSGQVQTATPKNFRFNNDYSSGYTDASLKLYLFNSGSTIQGFTSGPSYDIQYHTSGSNSLGRHTWYIGNTEVMKVQSSSGNVTILGSLSKGSGSFRIDHPLESMTETHQLVHSFVEAPQADLYYRGKLTLVNGKAQANIDEVATMTEGTFEALCREVQCFTTNETGWDLVKGKVIGNIIYIESQNTNSTDEISWLVIGERKDKHMMNTFWTDENGRVIVEPLKEIKQETENK